MKIITKVIPYLTPYKKEILLATIALVLVVCADLMIPWQIERIIDDGIAAGDMQVVINSTFFMIGLSLLSMLLSFVNTLFSVRVSEYFAADVRDAAYARIQDFSFANLDRLQTGELLVRLTSDNNIMKMAVLMVLRMFLRSPLMLAGALIMLVLTSPKLALLLVFILPITILLIWTFSTRSEPMFKAVQEKLDRVNTILQENIAGVRVVKAFVRENFEEQRFGTANEELMLSGVKVNQLLALLLPTMILVIDVSMAAIIYFGGRLTINGQLMVGEIVAFSNYMMMTMFPVMMLGMILPHLYRSAASFSRVMEIMDTEPAVVDKKDALVIDPELMRGRIVFENVTLDYNGASGEYDPVLQSVSFTADPGQTVAILGATGSGKSSLVNLIPRFYDVSAGGVMVDGLNVRQVTVESLRNRIGVALQESVLFSGTVRENIKFGHPEATDEQMITAAKAAQAHDFIMANPDGYDARVEQRGANFSGGQKQRIAIARALCTGPSILILDDSTSSVDVETEAKIQQELQQYMAGRTSIVVAQRISTVLMADKIIVLENGRIISQGTHQELIESSPIYQQIFQSQLGGGFSKAINKYRSHGVGYA